MALVVGVAAVVLAGLLGAFFLTRSGNDDTATPGDPETDETLPTESSVVEPVEDPSAVEGVDDPAPVVDSPTLVFDAAVNGPLLPGIPYDIELLGADPTSLLQVVVDDWPQDEPAPVLPRLLIPPGRHSIYVDIIGVEDQAQSDRIELYVLGDLPPQGYRVNLSSVDIANEGWAEAVRQFDEFEAAGHENLILVPLTDGFWNILVGGFGEDVSAATAYCESFGLAIPDDCFATYFTPAEAPEIPTTVPADPTTGAEDPADTPSTTATEGITDDTDAPAEDPDAIIDGTGTTAAGG